jgi:hypothetical protein
MAAVPISDLPASSVLYVVQNSPAGTWPNRPTSRTDIVVIWLRTVAGAADPVSVTSPAVNGAYNTGTGNDITFGP